MTDFCKALPVHLDRWREVLNDAKKPLQILDKTALQLRCMDGVKDESYKEAVDEVRFLLLRAADQEVALIKDLIEKLTKSNHDVKNKLVSFEDATLKLDWDDEDCLLIHGNATQPPLARQIHMGLNYYYYFANALKKMTSLLKKLDYQDERVIKDFVSSFKDVDLDHTDVTYLISLTQYIVNPRSVN